MKRGRNQRRRQGVNPNRALDSNGPEVRIRGTANQIYDKYVALARDAASSGDRVKAESYLQHAEHYFRVIRSMQPAQQQPQQQSQPNPEGDQPSIAEDDRDDRKSDRSRANGEDKEDGKAAQETGEEKAGDDDEQERRPRRRGRRRSPRRAQASGDSDNPGSGETAEDESAAAQ